MSEELDKSEQASHFKLSESRKKGEVAKSQEFLSAFSMLILCAVFAAALGHICLTLVKTTRIWFANVPLLVQPGHDTQLVYLARQLGGELFGSLLLAIGVGVLLIIVLAFFHVGPVFAPQTMAPNFARLNPVTGLKKIFTKRSLIEVVKMAFKLCVFSVVGYMILMPVIGLAGKFVADNTQLACAVWQTALGRVVVSFCMIALLFGLLDLLLTKREFAKKMRMSKRDVKDEHKRHEGSPEIKQKRRKNRNELVKKFVAMANVRSADVIVTNPTHYAVALQFRAHRMALPIVCAKGKGALARVVRRRASRYGVPIISSPVLARGLYAGVGIGEAITVNFYDDVASIYKDLIARPGNQVFAR